MAEAERIPVEVPEDVLEEWVAAAVATLDVPPVPWRTEDREAVVAVARDMLRAAYPLAAARVRAEADAERAALAAQNQELRDVLYGEPQLRTRRYAEALDRMFAAEQEVARVRAEERQRLADLILPHHWRTSQVWGGVRRDACGRCAYGDGVQWLWPCPTRQALTGEEAPEPNSAFLAAGPAVPVATPAPWCEQHGRAHCSLCISRGVWVSPVATPTEPVTCEHGETGPHQVPTPAGKPPGLRRCRGPVAEQDGQR